MGNPKIQIIIPVYNAEQYIRRCLDSLKSQTFPDWQAILVNDASKDGSHDILLEYAASDDRFKVFEHETNAGAAAARNTALAMLGAEYTAFLDADDYWEPDMLETMLGRAEEYGSDVVQCRFIYDFPNGNKILPKGAFSKDTLLDGGDLKRVYIRMMTGINMNHVCMKLVRTPLLSGLRFDTALRTAEDLKFCIELFSGVERYYFADRPLYHYCRNETSLTGGGLSFSEKLRANKAVSKELCNALPNWGIDNCFYRTLSRMRPYLIIFSKIFRMARERFTVKG